MTSLIERRWAKVRVEDALGLPFFALQAKIALPDGREGIFQVDADLAAVRGDTWLEEQAQEFIRLAS